MTKIPNNKSTRHAAEVMRRLHQEYPDADCDLNWETPLQLLVATILSAQCTDVRVNIITQTLFQKYFCPEDYVKVPLTELEEEIHSAGFYHNKARNIRGACREIIEEFDGEVPQTMDELLTLPGVARKTANVVLGVAFGISKGVVVDTHVKRVTYRLGMTSETAPPKVEQDLMKVIPQQDWVFAGHAIIQHGRRVCFARKPNCGGCVLEDICPKHGV